VNVHRRGNAGRPPSELVEFSCGKHRTLHAGNELGERADVYPNGLAPSRERFHNRGPTTDMRIEDKIARLSESLDDRTCEDRRKPRRVFVEAMRQSVNRRAIARGGD
jgi:hypothetical protein